MDTFCPGSACILPGSVDETRPSVNMKQFNSLRTDADLNRAVLAQNHLYGIDCKLSGAVDLLSEIMGSVPIIHGTRTCGYQHRIFPLRIFHPYYDLMCTGMDETDIIYGGTGKLKNTIIEAYRRHRPELIGVLSSCISGLMGEDFEGIIQDVKNEVPCSIIYVKTDGFRHRGSLTRIGFKRYLDYLKKGVWDMETEGCGWDEATMALVDQVMEPQDVRENTVNLECYGQYNYSYRVSFTEIRNILKEIGVELNTPFPHARLENIKKAPAAALNVSPYSVNLWPGYMKKQFGTDYVQKMDLTTGFEVMKTFYLEIGKYFHKEGEAEEAVKMNTNTTLAALEPFRRHFGARSFAFYSHNLLSSPYLIQYYLEEIGLPIRYICLDTARITAKYPIPEEREEVIKASLNILSGMDLRCDVVINPGKAGVRAMAGDVDYILTDIPASPVLADDKVWSKVIDISDIVHMPMACSYGTIVLFAGIISNGMNSARPKMLPIVRRIELDPLYHQSVNDCGSMASRRMWLDHCINSRV